MPEVAIEIRSQSDLCGLSAMSFSGSSTATLASAELSSALYMFQNALNIGFPAARQRAWAAALTLVAIVLVFNVLGRWLARRTGLPSVQR